MKRFLAVFLFSLFAFNCTKDERPAAGISNQIVVNTSTVSIVTPTSALVNGSIADNGGEKIVEVGFCWNTTEAPTINNNKITLSGNTSFSATIVGLSPGLTYALRAYVKTSNDVVYGNEVKFATLNIPVLTTSSISNITASAATCGGNITSGGGSAVTSRGVCWSTLASPTTANSKTIDGAGTGVFSSALTGLNPSTIYYVRAYATSAAGTAYGAQVTFTTSAPPPEACSITSSTTGTIYAMQAPAAGSVFTAGSNYKITLYSPVYSFGQATEVALFRNETKVVSFGSWLLFNESPSNARTFSIPSGLASSACYTIRVYKAEGSSTAVYVSPKFQIQ